MSSTCFSQDFIDSCNRAISKLWSLRTCWKFNKIMAFIAKWSMTALNSLNIQVSSIQLLHWECPLVKRKSNHYTSSFFIKQTEDRKILKSSEKKNNYSNRNVKTIKRSFKTWIHFDYNFNKLNIYFHNYFQNIIPGYKDE